MVFLPRRDGELAMIYRLPLRRVVAGLFEQGKRVLITPMGNMVMGEDVTHAIVGVGKGIPAGEYSVGVAGDNMVLYPVRPD